MARTRGNGRSTRSQKILQDFNIEDEVLEETMKDKVYTEVKQTNNISDELSTVNATIPIEHKTTADDTVHRQLNLDAIKNISTEIGSGDLDEDLNFYSVNEDTELDTKVEEDLEEIDFLAKDEENEEVKVVKDSTVDVKGVDLDTEEVVSINDFDDDINLDEHSNIGMDAQGGSEALNVKQFEFDSEALNEGLDDVDLFSDEQRDEKASGNEDIADMISKMDDILNNKSEEPDSKVKDLYDAISTGINETVQAVDDIHNYEPVVNKLREERISDESSELESEIGIPLDVIQLKEVEALVYKVPDDIKSYYSHSSGSIEKTRPTTITKITDLDRVLADMKEDVSSTVYLLTNRRKIITSLTNELTRTGKHYVKAEEIYPASLTTNIEIIERNDVKYYAFVNIPELYTGYRVPLHTFITNLKSGIKNDLIETGVFSIKLVDENSINILTLAEFRSIIDMIDSLGLFYKVENNSLIITY